MTDGTREEEATVKGFRSFEFDLPSALLAQLIAILDGMEQGPLLPDTTRAIPNAQGVYQLYHCGKLVTSERLTGRLGLDNDSRDTPGPYKAATSSTFER